MAVSQKESSRRYYLKKSQSPEWKALHAQRYKAWVAANPSGNRERNKKYRKQKPERFAVYQIRKNYNVSLDEAERLFNLKKDGCEVCGSMVRPSVDHSHKNGKVRGILCGHCNLAIGHAQEDIARLEALVFYLRRHQQ